MTAESTLALIITAPAPVMVVFLSVIAAHESGYAIVLEHNNCATSMMHPCADYCETGLVQTVDRVCAESIC